MTCCIEYVNAFSLSGDSHTYKNRQFLRRLFLFWLSLFIYLGSFCSHGQNKMFNTSQQKQFEELFSDPLNFVDLSYDEEKTSVDQFILLNARFISLMTTEREDHALPFHSMANAYIEQIIQEAYPSAPWALLSSSQISLYQALVYWHSDKRWKAFLKLRQAHTCFKRQKATFPQYGPNKKVEALFEILFGCIPDDYKRIAGWMGFQGNRTKGWQMLLNYETEAKKQPGWYKEWLMWNSFLALKLDFSMPKQDFHNDKIIQQTPILAFLIGWKSLKQHQTERCLFLTKNPNPNFPLLYYIRGMALLSDLKTNPALKYLELFNATYQGNSYKADALRRCAWIRLLENNPKEARILRQQVTRLATPSSMDKEAFRACTQDSLPNKDLLKARLLYDGGNYREALTHLKNIDTRLLSTNEKVEFHYRMGRLFLAIKEPAKAIPQLKRAYYSGKGNGTGYQAAYAALELARYYHKLPDPALKAEWIINCLKYNKGPYKHHLKQQTRDLENH